MCIIVYYNQPTTMHPHLHRKMRRFLTEPDEARELNHIRFRKLALKEYKFDIDHSENLNKITVPNPFNDKHNPSPNPNKHQPQPHAIKRAKQRQALFKLPEIINQNELIIEDDFPPSNPVFKRSNPLYVVNTLFQMMREDLSEKQAGLSHSKSNEHSRKDVGKSGEGKRGGNQFCEFQVKSFKMARPPRLLDNQINRLTQQSIFSRRRIYSEEKTRVKCDKEELITFYNCKEKLKGKAKSNNLDQFSFTEN